MAENWSCKRSSHGMSYLVYWSQKRQRNERTHCASGIQNLQLVCVGTNIDCLSVTFFDSGVILRKQGVRELASTAGENRFSAPTTVADRNRGYRSYTYFLNKHAVHILNTNGLDVEQHEESQHKFGSEEECFLRSPSLLQRKGFLQYKATNLICLHRRHPERRS